MFVKPQTVVPKKLRRSDRHHPWLFVYLWERPSEREDGNWYHALLFRNQDRTTFGAFEFLSESTSVPDFEHRYDVREIAARIVRDEAYRKSLLSTDARFRDVWKRL